MRGSNLLSELASKLLSDARGDAHGSDASGLRAPYHAEVRVAVLVKVLRQLRGLARARLPHHHHHLVLADDVQQLVAHAEDGQVAPLLREGLGARELGRARSACAVGSLKASPLFRGNFFFFFESIESNHKISISSISLS